MPVTLRAYTGADAAAINRLAVLAFSEYRDRYTDWPAMSRVLERMSEMAASADIIVAEAGERIVGAVGYMPPFAPKASHFKPEWALVRMLVVDPAARGLGAGRALSEECITRARRDRVAEIALHTSEMMTVALPMYLRMGFARVADAPPLFGVPYGIYVKRLL